MSPSWVEVMVAPWVAVTWMGESVGLMFLHLVFHIRKCFVAALSRAAVVVECVGGEEPIVLQVNWDNSCPLLLFLLYE